ncbi:MAG: 1-acyl-sn-glycerol-3-phosphate acyltransferase [Chthoniobacterales bacterium]|nr:1-acyl-sn-glycerol-3-phosphate acyltransferase [Chthoniobacterales bacterium]
MSSLRVSNSANEMVGACARPGSFRPGRYLRQMLATAYFFLVAIMASPIFWLLHKLAGRRIAMQTGQKMIRKLFRSHIAVMKGLGMLRLEIQGMEGLRDLRGTIIVSNHPSLFDAVLLIGNLPPSACVMRADLLRNPAMCGGALLAGYVTNDSGPAFVRQGIEKIRSGDNLLIFPEGTRTENPPLNPFKHGFAMVATHSRAAVQTVLIEYGGTHLAKGVSLFAPADVPLHFRLRVGERFQALPDETPRAFSRRMETWFREALETSEARH